MEGNRKRDDHLVPIFLVAIVIVVVFCWASIFSMNLSKENSPSNKSTSNKSTQTVRAKLTNVAGKSKKITVTPEAAVAALPTETVPIATATNAPSATPTVPTVTPTPTYTETPLFTPTRTKVPTQTKIPTRTLPPTITSTPLPEWVPLVGHIASGVKVYYGLIPEKTYGFEILGGSDNCLTIKRGLKVKYPSGSIEWKDRDYLINSGLFFVDRNDPAISKLQWHEYSGCP